MISQIVLVFPSICRLLRRYRATIGPKGQGRDSMVLVRPERQRRPIRNLPAGVDFSQGPFPRHESIPRRWSAGSGKKKNSLIRPAGG